MRQLLDFYGRDIASCIRLEFSSFRQTLGMPYEKYREIFHISTFNVCQQREGQDLY